MPDDYVYIVSNQSDTLYVGVTNDLARRLSEHLTAKKATFAGRYRMSKLVYVETTNDVSAAIAREKQIKGWTRARKLALIHELNPAFEDLSTVWLDVRPES